MTKQSRDASLELLVQGLLTLESPEECRNFLDDLCTASELAEMSRRLQAAKMLKMGYVYSEIAEQTGLSTATISRVNRCLKYGHEGGYHTVLERLEKEGRRR
jgi:TrpR-related protein YerC/YecD